MKGGPMTRRATAPGRVDILTDKTQLRQIRFAVCRWTLLLTAFLLVLAVRSLVSAATLPTGFTESLVASAIANPTAMALAPDGRLFVCEQTEKLRVIKAGSLLPTPFVTLSVDPAGEHGLLGVTFDPSFATNGYIYVYYTTSTTPVHNRVSRFTANGDVAVAGSETVILDLDNLSSATNHNGGAMHFGTDGKLYIAVGENANGGNSQTLANLLGKILRINSDGTIPTSNPFYNTATGNNRAIWALGLRNPFTFAVQPGTGDIFINDVGQNTWEEIDEGIAGANYGWPNTEGYTSDPRYVTPLYAYDHSIGCAITGGAFYNPPVNQFPSTYIGEYFFADYCGGWINKYDPISDTAASFASGLSNPVDLQVGSDGSLYYPARGSGSATGVVYRVQYTANQAPTITTQPVSQTVPVGGAVTFSVTASGTAPLGYQWQRNGTNISGATSASYSLSAVTLADSGAAFRGIVSNAYGSATSNAAILTVTSNRAPTGTITAPANGSLYSAGDTISYSGAATDPEDGMLPPSAFTWEVVFHHDTHTHPFIPPTSGAMSGSFVIPTIGETSANVWYRIHLTVKDSGGLTQTSYVDVVPRTVMLQLATKPPGLQVTLDGQPQTTPVSVLGVVGMQRTLGVVSPQTVGGATYSFTSWSDHGAATHTITTPATNTTYTASFTSASSTGGLVAAYAFSEGTGTTTADASGNNNTGTLVNGPLWTAGKYGNALSFDGVNEYVNVANALTLQLTAPFSVEAWVMNQNTTHGWCRIINKKFNWIDPNGWELTLVDPSRLPGGIAILGSGGTTLVLPCVSDWRTTNLNQWVHVAVVFNVGNTVTLYCNGVQKGSGSIDPVLNNARPLQVGRTLSELATYLRG